ncbi:MAG: hypothetical protein A6F72_00520 [Cycloclasticus sp. symbiont of Poecilosclerida sp. N]|nr:MAG: hypothetical protein A6F72_00520 [Cycloclasticus sp. symbiont of Poecilosclerida sp. N]
MKADLKADLVIDASLMAIWRRKPKQKVLVHSDQDIQHTCRDWRQFLRENNLENSLSCEATVMTIPLLKASFYY